MELKEIGKVHHSYSDDEVRDRAGSLDGDIEIYEEFSEGLKNLEDHKYIFVISIMHKHIDEKFPLKIRPRLLLRKGYRLEDLPEIGVFASDSPSRPNPIGLSLLKITGIKGNILHVSGLDVFDGTPVADIKPLSSRYLPENVENSLGPDECETVGEYKKRGSK